MIIKGEPSTRYRWRGETIAQVLANTAEQHGENVAFVSASGATATWQEMRDRAIQLAKGMAGLGVRRGDHVAVWLPNSTEWFIVWLAASHLGVVTVPINTRYGPRDLEHILRDSEATVLFMREQFLGHDYVDVVTRVDPFARSEDFPRFRHVVTLGGQGSRSAHDRAGWLSWAELIELGGDVPVSEIDDRAASVAADDTTVIIYTSGSTGFPKGVMHSHAILEQEGAIADWLDIDADSRALGHMPFYHVAGGLSATLPALITGSRVVLMDSWDAGEALRLIEAHRITVFGGIATHFIDLLNHPGRLSEATSSLHVGWMGGSLNPPEIIQRAVGELGMIVLPVYGMTETTSVTTYPRATDPVEILVQAKGIPISDYEVKVVDIESGIELDVDEPGEICVRGHLVMKGYYRNVAATEAVMDDDGWFHTGDIGRIDDSGYLRIVGRQKDMLIVGGTNVYPAEVEKVLLSRDDITLAHVVSVPDERLGEVPVAFVERADPELTADRLATWCAGELPGYKRPRHHWFVDRWPYLDNGKVDRLALQRTAVETLDLGELAERRLLEPLPGQADQKAGKA